MHRFDFLTILLDVIDQVDVMILIPIISHYSIPPRHTDAQGVPVSAHVPAAAILPQQYAVGHARDVRALRPTTAPRATQ